MKRTKIVCTIGPASEAPEKLAALSEAGMKRSDFRSGRQHFDLKQKTG